MIKKIPKSVLISFFLPLSWFFGYLKVALPMVPNILVVGCNAIK
jgi:hypothetical protein